MILLALGVAFRLIIAYLLPGSGFRQDLDAFRFWAANLAAEGPWGFYERDFFHDYTPGYLYVLWAVGLVGQLFGGVGDLIKVPPILADAALAWLAWRMVHDLGGSSRRALLAGAIVLVNPVTWFDSVVWGQVDSFGVVFLLLAVRELWRGRTERAAILAVAAALIKPQLGILAPIVAAVTFRRALLPLEPAVPGAGREARWGPMRILTTGVAGFLTAVALSAPFGLSVVAPAAAFPFVDSALVRQLVSTAAGYPYVTVNAYNMWALLPVDGQSLASAGRWLPDLALPDGGPFATVLGLPAVVVGTTLLLGAIAVVCGAVARRPDRATILVGLAVLAIAFFALPTRVHERYSFPFFAVAAILAAVSYRWRVAYVVAAVATFLNMYVVLTTLYPGNPSISDWLGIGPFIRSWTGVALVAVAHTAVLAWALVQIRWQAQAELRRELLDAAWEGPDADDGSADEGWVATVEGVDGRLARVAGPPAASGDADPADPPAAPAPRAGSRAVAAPAPEPAPRRRVPAWLERPSWERLGPVEWLAARMRETPIRPDRTAVLRRESPGRLDRLDLWLVLVLVVASLVLRTFRLAEPTRMHFDEVYHARTAAEFLQAWRYDLDHPIYEWTHPHLAKYGMAAGIVAFAGRDVAATGDLGVPVRDAALEPRREDPAVAGRAGERLWVATGDELVAWDLATRRVVDRWAVPGASAVAFDPTGRQVLVGTEAGDLLELATTWLDAPADGAVRLEPARLAVLDGRVSRVAALDGGETLAAVLGETTVVLVDVASGAERGRHEVEAVADLVAAGRAETLVAEPAEIADPAAFAAVLAGITGLDAAGYAEGLAAASAAGTSAILAGLPTGEARTTLDQAIADGRLAGLRLLQEARLAVATPAGLDLLWPDGSVGASVPMDGGASGLAVVSGIEDGTQLWATTVDGTTGTPEVAIVALTGERAANGPNVYGDITLPGEGRRIAFDSSSQLVEVLGAAPGGTGSTVYVIEGHGRSVFADHRLPFAPAAWAMDTNPQYPAADRGELLVLAEDGAAASLDVGHYAFAWRMPGVILGALTAALLFVIGRLLFRRREVGLLAGLFVLFDGMFFVQSRIAMNDVYTGTFILAAYALFAALWLRPERMGRFWALMPVVGVLLGLGLASKWVAAYAIGALGLLVLARSALGRILLILGLVALTAVLGWLAINVPAESGGSGNLPFVLLMIVLTLAAVVVAVLHPVAWSDDEIRFAVAAPAAIGIVVALATIALGNAFVPVTAGPVTFVPIAAGFALVLLGLVVALAFGLAARAGFGPLAPPAPPDPDAPPLEPAAPPPPGWVRLGWGGGLPAAWLAVCLVAVPLGVYVLSYVPWAQVNGHRLWEGWPAGHTGQTLLALTGEMYRYHNELTSPHAASSPWWAWPLNLKPVWFYQGGFAGSTGAAIYDAGNLAIWWMGVPALVFAGWMAFRRRSLGLALITIGFLAQWVAWSRIDRAAFQYHYYTSLPFVVLALAYLVAELWHGASRRTWWWARLAAGAALLGPVILWLLRYPLCRIADVDSVNPNGQACHGNPGNLELNAPTAALVAVGLVGGWLLLRLVRSLGAPRADGAPRGTADLLPVGATALAAGLALGATRLLPADLVVLSVPGIVPELVALVVAIPLGILAVQVVTARDARRFVIGYVAAVAGWFVVLYPNIAALPLPSVVVSAYQGLLPTYLYPFQFGVNQLQRGGSISFADPRFLLLFGALAVAVAVVAYSAWIWRGAFADPEPAEGESAA